MKSAFPTRRALRDSSGILVTAAVHLVPGYVALTATGCLIANAPLTDNLDSVLVEWRTRSLAEWFDLQAPTCSLYATLADCGVRRYTCAHRLVWHAIVGPIPDGMYINHLNGKKDDNRPENLQVCSPSENHKHAHREGLIDQRGERNPASKISDAGVAMIRLRYAAGGITQQSLADEAGVSHTTISKIVRGERRQSQLGRSGNYIHRRQDGIKRRTSSGQFAASNLPDALNIQQLPRHVHS